MINLLFHKMEMEINKNNKHIKEMIQINYQFQK